MVIVRTVGDTYADVVTVLNTTTGLPVNILGYLFTMTLDPSSAPATSASNLYTIDGAILDAAAGTVKFQPSSVQADQVPGDYYFEIRMTDTSGLKRTIDHGRYTYRQKLQ